MKLKINRQVFLAGLNKVARAVNPKVPLIALTGIKITLSESSLELIGSDSDLSIRCVIPCKANDKVIIEASEYGSIVITEKIICEIIRKMESETIEIETVDNIAKIRSDKSIFTVNCFPSIDYPQISFDKDPMGCEFRIDALELKTTFDQTLFASSDKEARPILTGLNIKSNNEHIECVATDTYRLTRKLLNNIENLTFNVTVPRSSLDEINKIIELGNNVLIHISDKKVLFEFDDCVVSSRVIPGSFPDTSRLIPETFTQTLNISTKELVGAVERASILLTDKNNVVKLTMSEQEVFISSRTMEVGNVVEKLNDFGYTGEPLTISFSAKYLLDAIRALNSEEISLCFTGDMKPIIVISKTNPNLIQLILPVRTYN